MYLEVEWLFTHTEMKEEKEEKKEEKEKAKHESKFHLHISGNIIQLILLTMHIVDHVYL